MPEEIKLSGGTPFCPPGGTDTTGVGIIDPDLDAEPVAKPAEVTEAEAAGEPELLPPIAGADAGEGEGDNVGMGIAPFARLLLLPTPLLLAGPAAAPLN